MILGAYLKALAQFGDPRFRGVLWRGLVLTLALLAAVYALVIGAIVLVVPDHLTLPWIGTLHGIDTMLSIGSLLLMVLLSVFLMVPVASAFTGLFLDEVAAAVEARHYPGLPAARPLPWSEALGDGVAFLAVILAANLLGLVVYVVSGPLAPVLFWAVNGYLLGREFFQMAALRRVGRKQADALRRQNAGQIWLAGALLAMPLSVPFVNILVPILGAAAFTHLFHRFSGTRAASANRAAGRPG